MEHPLDTAIRVAQAVALKEKRTLYVIQDGMLTYGTCTPEQYSGMLYKYPISAIINPDGLIAAKNF